MQSALPINQQLQRVIYFSDILHDVSMQLLDNYFLHFFFQSSMTASKVFFRVSHNPLRKTALHAISRKFFNPKLSRLRLQQSNFNNAGSVLNSENFISPCRLFAIIQVLNLFALSHVFFVTLKRLHFGIRTKLV